jgi:hypothetical protein
MHPPDLEMRKPAADQDRGAISQDNLHTKDSISFAASYQAQKLRRLFSFCQATACTIANLAWGVAR